MVIGVLQGHRVAYSRPQGALAKHRPMPLIELPKQENSCGFPGLKDGLVHFFPERDVSGIFPDGWVCDQLFDGDIALVACKTDLDTLLHRCRVTCAVNTVLY